MRRFFALLLVGCVLLSGCSVFTERMKEPVTFYYLRTEYAYFTQDGVIAWEEREASGHRNDLSYLLSLYMMGPSGDSLKSPLPAGTRILKIEQTGESVSLKLTDNISTMTDMEFTLACACLALTCFDLTDAEAVTISGGERSLTMDRDTISLYDRSEAAMEETQ